MHGFESVMQIQGLKTVYYQIKINF